MPQQREPLSETSGAAKKRAKKAAAAAAANPIGLSELVEAALVMFAERGQRSFYRSMLRKQVETIDKAKRSFTGSSGERCSHSSRRRASSATMPPETTWP